MLPRVAVLDDTQNAARSSADWHALDGRAEITVLQTPFASEDDAAVQLQPFAVVVPMRERTPFPASLLRRLPHLRLIAMTGARAPTLDVAACTAAGVLVCNTGINTSAATAELAFALMLACARAIPRADAVMRAGGWHGGLPMGFALEGRRLGILGLGKLGSRVAAYGRAFGMDVVAWSQNLTDAAAEAQGVRRVEKRELFTDSDVVSLHLVLSERTRGIVGPAELAAMKLGAILVNTSRGPLVDEAALVAAVYGGRIRAGLAHHPHDFHRGGAAHEAVVDEHDALALDRRAVRRDACRGTADRDAVLSGDVLRGGAVRAAGRPDRPAQRPDGDGRS